MEKKQASGFQSWLMSSGGINCSIETSYEKEVSTSGFPPSKKSLRARDVIFSVSIRLLGT